MCVPKRVVSTTYNTQTPPLRTTPLTEKQSVEGEEEMSKYDNLLQPLPCLWLTGPEGSPCGMTFTESKHLKEHLKEDHIRAELASRASEGKGGNGGSVCGWSGCGQVVSGGEKALITHALFHPYHCFLKLLGAELQVRRRWDSSCHGGEGGCSSN